jgi:hypothetical protein
MAIGVLREGGGFGRCVVILDGVWFFEMRCREAD